MAPRKQQALLAVEHGDHGRSGRPDYVLLEASPSGNSTSAMPNRDCRLLSTTRSP